MNNTKLMTSKICKICLQSDFLCSGCNSKLESGIITKTDVDVSRALFKLSKELKNFNVDFIRAIETENKIIIIVDKKNIGSLIGKSGKNVTKLEKLLNKKIRIIEDTKDEKKMIENIIGVSILAINKIYAADEIFKIRIEKRFARHVDKNISEIIEKILNKKIKIVFE